MDIVHIGLFIGGLIFYIIGLFGVFLLLEARNDFKKKGWPSVKGTIQTSELITEHWKSDDGDIWWSVYEPDIVYEYLVGGKNYIAKDPLFQWTVLNAKELVEKYPVGKQVDVF